MIKSVNYTYENIDKILDKYDEIITKLYKEACELLKDRWVFMDSKKVVYDNEVAACIPNTDYYECIYYSNVYNTKKEHIRKVYADKFTYEDLTWDFMTLEENKKIFDKNNKYPFKYGTYKFKYRKNEFSEYISYLEDDGHCYYRDIYNEDIGMEARCIVPIYRLKEKNSNKLQDKEVFTLWLDNEFIPRKTKYLHEYKLFIKINKAYKLDITDAPKVNREVIKNDNETDALKLNFSMKIDKIKEQLLTCDKLRADIEKYDEKILTDPNRGHWELTIEPTSINNLKIGLEQDMVYRNPLKDVKEGGIVGIDFGTKSTIVVYQENSTDIVPMRVGTGNLKKEVESKHYENPTVMEFINIENFIKLYNEKDGRPNTRWEDLTVSHTAFDSLVNSSNDNYNSYLSELKQWCGNKDKRIRIKDKNGKSYDLPTFLELGEDELNPIEIYAYYLGLYINNMHNGIYLNYILSFPVTYEKEVREKIIKSFEKGLRKSLPHEILEDEDCMNKFAVLAGASEPAAYAISALTEYGFDPEDDEKIFYGVFDFGGGTTDFDFGIYREANQKGERRFDYVIEHFGCGGDRYLGGENILELLAFEVFKENASKLRENAIRFVLPPECKKFAGSEVLLSESQEARLNTRQVMEKLRPLWEKHEDYKDLYDKGAININLYKNDGNMITNFELDIDIGDLETIIKNRIEKGVRNFFESIRMAFKQGKTTEIEKINIFLAGNSSKSVAVKELFEKYIEDEVDDMSITLGIDIEEIQEKKNSLFEIFPPLGTEDAYKKQEDIGIDVNRSNIERPTGKTGVAFGLIEGRKGGKIKIINKNNNEEDEVRFNYYVGDQRKKKFKPILNPETNYNTWCELIDASEEYFEIYYSNLPEASTNSLPISETTKVTCKLSKTFEDEDVLIYIRAVQPSVIEYVIGKEIENGIETLSEITKIQLD